MNLPNVRRHELIGLTLEIISAKNPNLVGLKGKIIDETKNMLTIRTKNASKKIIKNQSFSRITPRREAIITLCFLRRIAILRSPSLSI